jgi:putative sigma-54 modulation protein
MNATDRTSLPIHVIPHHLTLSPALYDFAREKVSKIPRIAGDAQAATVVLRRHHGTSGSRRFSASARLAVTGRDIHATAAHADLYTAIVKLVGRLARLSRKRKTRSGRTRSLRRARSPSNHFPLHASTQTTFPINPLRRARQPSSSKDAVRIAPPDQKRRRETICRQSAALTPS